MNYGVSGDTAEMGLERVEEMLSHRPDLAVVCFGLNDSAAGMSGLAGYRTALRAIFEKLRGLDILFMTPNRMADRVYEFPADAGMRRIMEEVSGLQKDGVMDAYMDCARSLCAQENVPVCDCYALWSALQKNGVDTAGLLANQINHPTKEMHWAFAFKLCEAFFTADDQA